MTVGTFWTEEPAWELVFHAPEMVPPRMANHLERLALFATAWNMWGRIRVPSHGVLHGGLITKELSRVS
jgi:hypothetical protein